MKLIQNFKSRINLFLMFTLMVGILGFITVFVGVINLNTTNTLMIMIVLSIAAVILGLIIAMVVISKVTINLLSASMEYLAKGNLKRRLPDQTSTKQIGIPTPTVRVWVSSAKVSSSINLR